MTYFFLARPHAVFPFLEEEEKKNKAGEGDGQEQTFIQTHGAGTWISQTTNLDFIRWYNASSLPLLGRPVTNSKLHVVAFLCIREAKLRTLGFFSAHRRHRQQ